MAKKSKKTKLLEIMIGILDEYITRSHKTQVNTCALCHEYMHSKLNCDACPMNVFKINSPCIYYPCMYRKCLPVSCEYLLSENELKRVTLFYKRAIAKIESMSTDAVRKSSFKFLIKIDNEVFDEI